MTQVKGASRSEDRFEQALDVILEHEGGFVNHPKDPGGMTNLGVTKRVYEEWVGRSVQETEMRSLTPAKVAPIYKANYWQATKCDELPESVALCVFDSAVNSGTRRAAKWLQKSVGAVQDGIIGPMTLAAVRDKSEREIINAYMDSRLSFLRSLRTWSTFGRGWKRRVEETRQKALNKASS